jgi:phage gp29-like protein
MHFLDWFKQKLTPAQVKARQTDSPQAALLHREFAGHPSRGLTPARLAAILVAAEEGDMIAQAELYMDMREKDTHIDAEMHKREMAVKKLDWTLEPPRNASAQEEANTQLLEDLIRDELDIGSIRMDALDAIGHGYACLELGWGRTAQGLWFPNRIEHRSPSWFTCPPDQRNTLHLRDSGTSYGVPLQPFGWIVHQHKSRAGYIARTGLYRSLVWPYLYKNYSVRDLAEFLEVYGLPIRIGKYPATAGDKEKRDLLRTVLSIGHNAAGIIPDSMQLELQSVLASGNADSFKTMIDWCEASQSKAILGGTLTSSTGANGNRSLGDVHNEVRLDIRDDDATQLDQTLSAHLVYPMAMLNGLFADNRCPSFVSDTQEPDDLTLYADALPKLVAVGARIPLRYVNQKLKIPEPEDGEEILSSGPNPMSAESGPQAASLAALTTACQFAKFRKLQAEHLAALAGDPASSTQSDDSDPTSVDTQTELLAASASSSVKGWIEVIGQKVEQVDSLEALRDELLSSYGAMDSGELVKVMQLAFAAAELSGRFDVTEGG